MNNKHNKNKLIYFLILSIILLLTVIICSLIFLGNTNKINSISRYKASIIVELTKKDEDSKEVITLDLNDDGKAGEVSTSFLRNTLYIDNKKIYYEQNGRIKNISRDRTYRDIYSILQKIEIDGGDGNYHPDIKMDVINELLDSLVIDYELNRDTVGNMTIKDGKIEEFSVYLRNFYKYDKLGIIITFEDLEEEYSINKPVFYGEVADVVEEKELRFIE